MGRPTGRGEKALDRPSIDLVDSSKGYTDENTRIICMRCNKIKNCGEHLKLFLMTFRRGRHLTYASMLSNLSPSSKVPLGGRS